MSERAILLLAGGAGTRLWPLSTDEKPKQFLEIFDGESLLQRAYARVRQIVEPSRIFFATNERYRGLIASQLPEAVEANLITEPARRNTAPAIAVACAEIEKRIPGVTIGIFPSDHFIGDVPAFLDVVARAFDFASSSDYLVTLGITPTEPNTGFGYLELGDELAPGVRQTRRYVEKPTRERAAELIRSGHVWNGGMFIWKAGVFAAALRAAAPQIAEMADRIRLDPVNKTSLYESMPSISIDFAVMEKAPKVATAPGDFDWSDVGSWSAVARLAPTHGNAIVQNAKNVYVRSDSDRRVAIVGLDGVAVIDSPNGLLVLNLDQSEVVTEIVKKLPNP